MKWLALLVVVVLAEDLNDRQNPEGNYKKWNLHDHERISKLKVDPKLVVAKYVDAAETFPPPAIEYGDCGGEQFKKNFDKDIEHWGYAVNDIIYNQGVAAGQNLIDAVEDKYTNFVNSIGQWSKNDSGKNNADRDLQCLVEQLKTLLDLKPGNQKIEHEVKLAYCELDELVKSRDPLRKLPEIPTKILSQTKNRTASDFFLQFLKFYDEDIASVYGFVSGIFLRGWQKAREYIVIQETVYRNQILNNWVLPAYRKVVENVFKNRDHIEKCVDQDTWKSFVNYGNLIIKISNEWLKTLATLGQYDESG